MNNEYKNAIDMLKNGRWSRLLQPEFNRAAKVLEDYPKWEKLIAAAGLVESPRFLGQAMRDLTTLLAREGRTAFVVWMEEAVLPILSALPDKPEGGQG
jgi:hypothetical protein